MTEENTMPETAQAPTQTMLSVADLKMMARIIQVGSQRGSFKAEELVTVGGLYDKIIGFLRDAGQLDPAPEEAPAQDADAVEAEVNEDAPAAEATMMPEEIGGDIPASQDIAN